MKNVKTFVHFVYIEKTTLTTENRSPVLHILFLLDIPTFNKLVTKNDPVKKATLFFVFMEGVQLPHGQALVLEDRTLHRKLLSKLCRNSKFNILVNFNFTLSTPPKF